MYRNFLKHKIDLLGSLLGLIVLSPLLVLATLFLLLANKGKPFFVQTRPGKNGIPFKIIKFKTMHDKRDENGSLLPDKERLTSIGNMIRKTSIDELPQLINVIKGDLSLVGPRPLLTEYLPLYNPEQSRRHLVKPGITGWAQVNGRNAISWEEKFRLDVVYVDKISFAMDIKILLLTVKKVFVSEGISQDGKATVEYFTGNN